MKITLELTVEETNYILAALGQRPFAEVVELISRLKKEAEAQLTPVPEPSE
jgi:hypothetical protein